jgi:hypothetical protein
MKQLNLATLPGTCARGRCAPARCADEVLLAEFVFAPDQSSQGLWINNKEFKHS